MREKLSTTAMAYRPSEMIWGSEGRHLFLAEGENYIIASTLTNMTVYNSNRMLCQRTWKRWMDREEEDKESQDEASRQSRSSERKKEIHYETKKQKKTKNRTGSFWNPSTFKCCSRLKAIAVAYTCQYLLTCYDRVRPPDASTNEVSLSERTSMTLTAETRPSGLRL